MGREVLKVLTVVMGSSCRAIIPLTQEAVTSTALNIRRRWSGPFPSVRKGLTKSALSAVASRSMKYTPLRFRADFLATS